MNNKRCFRTNKVIYTTEDKAEEKLKRIKWDSNKEKPVRCYQCDYCGLWHLTKQNPDDRGTDIKHSDDFKKFIE